MTHDPLCPCKPQVIGHGSTSGDVQAAAPAVACQCDLIAKVRQDERINSLGTRVRELKPYANGYCDGERDMHAKCITAVEEIIPDDSDSGSWEATIAAAWLRHAVSKLRALEEKP
jgi:hypothetical protein